MPKSMITCQTALLTRTRSKKLLPTSLSPDDDAADEAAAALASVDGEFGRTTDPVRMYMREMGTVELLTREGEIEIAKRIEEGLGQVQSALATYPGTVQKILDRYAKVTAEEARPAQQAKEREEAAENGEDDEEEEVVDTGPDPEEVRERMLALEEGHRKAMAAIGKIKDGSSSDLQKATTKTTAMIMELKMSPNFIAELTGDLRSRVNRIRGQEKSIRDLCVNRCDMPRAVRCKNGRSQRGHSAPSASYAGYRGRDRTDRRPNQGNQPPYVYW